MVCKGEKTKVMWGCMVLAANCLDEEKQSSF